MNTVQLIGRLTRDVTTRTAAGGLSVARYTLAVDRRFKKDGEQDADFISVVAFGKTADFASKYFRKGMRVGVTGRIQTGSYVNNDGITVYTTDVVAENQEFADTSYYTEKPAEKAESKPAEKPADDDGFFDPDPEVDIDELFGGK